MPESQAAIASRFLLPRSVSAAIAEVGAGQACLALLENPDADITAVSLDRISGGRAAINIVNGWWKEEFETFGHGWQPQDDDARYRRMDEFVRVLRGLWQEDVFDFHGEFYTVNGQALPLKSVQLPHPPIYAGTRNETGKEVAPVPGSIETRAATTSQNRAAPGRRTTA